MRYAGFSLFPILAATLLLSPGTGLAASTAATAYDWLMKMNRATRELNYDGTFVFQQGQKLEAMRIIHWADKGSVKERLVSLNGTAREIIRDDQQVMCYLPDRKSVVVEHRLARGKSFPVILPKRLEQLQKHYEMQLGRMPARVAGRDTQVVVILPRDSYRYGYRLWADKESGLLLKADLIDQMGSTLEQFMFTQVNIGVTIDPQELEPDVSTDNMAWYWGKRIEQGTVTLFKGWSVGQVPSGFVLSNKLMRKNPRRNKPVKHLVYSDGLAAVSIFIEKFDKDGGTAMKGQSSMGAVHAFGDVINDYQITVVGEVPAATVELIGKSVRARP
ncbi:MAG: MucB/RseB C-terminal domain-containing protein [Acidiferrobacterales bacterium]